MTLQQSAARPAATALCSHRFGPGEGVGSPQPGDFILVRGDTWRSRTIRLIQRVRFRQRCDPSHLHWSHAALIAGSNGRIIEVVNSAVCARHIEKYRGVEYQYVRIDAPPDRRQAAVGFAESCIGRPYGRFSGIAALAAFLTYGRCFGRAWPMHNCVALVAQALTRAGAIFPRAPHEMLPADLARHYSMQ
jgi:hypothetical protein